MDTPAPLNHVLEDKENQRITCICGSRVLRKNISIHEKTVKHRKSIGVVSKEMDRADKTGKKPVKILDKRFYEDEDFDDEGDFEEEILDSLDDIKASQEEIYKLLEILVFEEDTDTEERKLTGGKTEKETGEQVGETKQ
jgi:DNA-directed RNA polymerase subunit RPC12/RpoP